MKNYPTLHLDTNSRKEHYLINTTRSDINSPYYWDDKQSFFADDTTLCDKVCQWLAAGRWFPPISSGFLQQ